MKCDCKKHEDCPTCCPELYATESTASPLYKYEQACRDLAGAFLAELYPEYDDLPDDAYWVGDEVGGLMSWGDWFLHANDMANYFKFGYMADEFFEWYDYTLEQHERGETPINMKNFKKLKRKNK